ncbi:TPA: hypothetical protein ACGOVU_000464 [Streptococcus suis]
MVSWFVGSIVCDTADCEVEEEEMTPEEKFLKFASEHSVDYIQGWLDGLGGAIEVLRSLPKKAESSDSTSEID